MFFTKLGMGVAWLAFIVGALRLGIAFEAGRHDNYAELARRYFGSKTLGEVIDQSFLVMLFGIALGVVAEISRSLNKPRT